MLDIPSYERASAISFTARLFGPIACGECCLVLFRTVLCTEIPLAFAVLVAGRLKGKGKFLQFINWILIGLNED